MTQAEYEELRAELLADIEVVRDDPESPKDRSNYVIREWVGVLNDLEEEALSFGLRLMDNPPLPSAYEDWPYPFVISRRFLRAFENGTRQPPGAAGGPQEPE